MNKIKLYFWKLQHLLLELFDTDFLNKINLYFLKLQPLLLELFDTDRRQIFTLDVLEPVEIMS